MLVFMILLFIFMVLGMYIGRHYNLKYFSINAMFGLFLINGLVLCLGNAFSMLTVNYHDTTYIYVFLCIVIGIISMRVIEPNIFDCDDVSIACFSLVNSYVLGLKFRIFLFLVFLLYYIIMGIYVNNSKSWISIIIGSILGFILSLIGSWWLGYLFAIVAGVIFYFVYSISIVVFKNSSKLAYVGLISGIIIGLFGTIL